MDKRDTMTVMNACMVLVVGMLGLGTCLLLYLDHAQFRDATDARIEGLEDQVRTLKENADRARQQQLGQDDGVTDF